MQVTYLKYEMRDLCEQVLQSVQDYRDWIQKDFETSYAGQIDAYNQLPWYRKLFSSPPIDVTDSCCHLGKPCVESMIVYNGRLDYLDTLSCWDAEMKIARQILIAMNGSSDESFQVPYSIVAQLKTAAVCMEDE